MGLLRKNNGEIVSKEIESCSNIRNSIIYLRKERNITQEKLANALDVSVQAVSKWETGSSLPDILQIPRIALFFEVSIDSLFYGTVLPAKTSTEKVERTENESIPDNIMDDDKIRIVQYKGKRLLRSDDFHEGIIIPVMLDNHMNSIEIWGNATIEGDVSGNVKVGTSITCADVSGDVTAGNTITCADIDGDAKAGNTITCADIDGNASAGTSITCCDIDGFVNAGGDIRCKQINGDIMSCGGSIVSNDDNMYENYIDTKDESCENEYTESEELCLPDRLYRIKNVNSGKMLDVPMGYDYNGVSIQQWEANGTNAQIWKVERLQNHYYMITSAVSNYTKCLDVLGSNANNGNDIILYDSWEGDNQQFIIRANDDGSYRILTKSSHGKSALDVFEMGQENGNSVVQWEYWGGAGQNWIFEPVQ